MPEDEPPIQEQLTLEDAIRGDSAFLLDDVATPPRATTTPGVDAGAVAPVQLRRLWLRNFKGFFSFEIAFGGFNVLAGANNSGKSTILQAADLLFRLVDLHRQGGHLVEGRNVPLALLPVATLRDLWYRQRYRTGKNQLVRAVVGAEFGDGAELEFGIIGPFAAANSRLLRADGITEDRLRAIAARPAVWVPSSVGVVRDEEYRPSARRSGLIAAGRHNEVLRNQLLDLSNQETEYRELQRLLTTHFGGGLSSVSFDQLLDQFVTATYAEPNVQHDLYSVGAGFLQVLQLLCFVLARTPSVILLDEPDAHLHSSLQRTVVDVLDDLSRRRNTQVVLSTHSKEIINYVDPSRLILIEKGASAASPFGEAATQLTILQSLGAVDSVDAYTLVRNKRCLFVEGTTDVAVIERLAARLGKADFAGDDRVTVVPVGGADRFEHVAQLDVLEAVLGTAIVSFEVQDRDARTDDARNAAMAAAGRPLHVLERDCLESYLVHPGVIARVVALASAERGGTATPNPADIERIALEETDKLKDAALDRVADRYAKDQHRTTRSYPSITESNRVARGLVKANWTDLESRLRVVPGKRFLAALRTRLQSDFHVSFGNGRLVEEFEPGEMPLELREILDQVSAIVGPRGAVPTAVAGPMANEDPGGIAVTTPEQL